MREALDRASQVDDPWAAFELYVTLLCEPPATSPALNDVVSSRFPDATEPTRICDAQMPNVRRLVDADRRAGQLRDDFTAEDLAYLLWSTPMVVRATTGIAPEAWRRPMALALDGPPVARPAPMTEAEVHEAMIRLGTVSASRR